LILHGVGKKPGEKARMEELLILRRKRATRTAEATQRLQERNKRENRETRLRYARLESERIAEYKRKVAANFAKHADMYNNSPFRHDVGANYERVQAKKRKEALQEQEHARIYKILEGMKGTPKVDTVRMAPEQARAKVMSDPLSRIELERRTKKVDAQELRKEYAFVDGMLRDCLKTTRRRFPILDEKLPSIADLSEQPLALNPHTDRTKFIRNHADFVAHLEGKNLPSP